MATVFLTFDDGPLAGSDDVVSVLNTEQVKGTLFMVGVHVQGSFRQGVLETAKKSPFVEIGNHSNTHANNQYQLYYQSPNSVLQGFRQANNVLGLSGQRIPARLPGRNTWRVGNIISTDSGSGPAADLLARNGFSIYGWDVEWPMSGGKPATAPADVVANIERALSNMATKKPDKVVVLMHDVMFRASTEGREQLVQIIKELKKAKHTFSFISDF
jgi:peptidoglycan/xylan/chitin deacetylase (PgdA/CDA1 family)